MKTLYNNEFEICIARCKLYLKCFQYFITIGAGLWMPLHAFVCVTRNLSFLFWLSLDICNNCIKYCFSWPLQKLRQTVTKTFYIFAPRESNQLEKCAFLCLLYCKNEMSVIYGWMNVSTWNIKVNGYIIISTC